MSRFKAIASIAALCGLAGSVPGVVSAGDKQIQEIKNVAAITTANDLSLTFSTDISGVPELKDKDGKSSKGVQDGKTNTYKWAKGSLPSDFGPGASGAVHFETLTAGNGAKIDKASSFWTKDDEKIVDALASLGAPPGIGFDHGYFAEFTNPESFALTYSGIQLFKNNDLSNYTLDTFDVPTGVLVTGLPSSITLDPGETMRLAFGAVAGGTYQMASALAAAASDPGQTFRVVGSSAIPEPSSLALLGAGGLILAAAARRRSRRARDASRTA